MIIPDIVDLNTGIVYEVKTISNHAGAPFEQMDNYQKLVDESKMFGTDINNQLLDIVAGGELSEVRYIVIPGGEGVDIGEIVKKLKEKISRIEGNTALRVKALGNDLGMPSF